MGGGDVVAAFLVGVQVGAFLMYIYRWYIKKRNVNEWVKMVKKVYKKLEEEGEI